MLENIHESGMKGESSGLEHKRLIYNPEKKRDKMNDLPKGETLSESSELTQEAARTAVCGRMGICRFHRSVATSPPADICPGSGEPAASHC